MSPPDVPHLNEQIQRMTAVLQLHAAVTNGIEDTEQQAHWIGRVAELEQRTAEREVSSPGLACVQLARRLGLSPGEQQIVWLLVAIALSATARELVARWGRTTAADPTLETIRSILFGATASIESLEALSQEAPLRRFGVIERSDGGGAEVHESRQTWTVSRRVLEWVHGSRRVAATLPTVESDAHREAVHELAIDPSTLDEIVAALGGELRDRIVMISGVPGSGRRTLMTHAVRRVGGEVLVVDGRRLGSERDLDRQARAIALECRLLERWPLVVNVDAVTEPHQRSALVRGLSRGVDGPILATCGVHRPRIDGGRSVVAIGMRAPTGAQRAKLWLAALGQGTDDDGEILASHYPLAPAVIVRAAEAVRARARGQAIAPAQIADGIRTVLDDRIGQFARRVEVTQTWDDLVLSQDQRDSIAELAARVRGRHRVYEQWGFGPKVGKGLGVTALLSGPPGTGKTMVAALVAKDLGIDLYQVDLAKVVSKFIGETEQHLAALFDAAEAGHAILLFDEADALFGKRTDVKSSNDRYANLETNYLLQRLESFTGICLLTSNHETHIDPAFQRRLSLHLRFELPDADERADLWRATLPGSAPVATGIDFAALGRRFAMSGGYIRNAALRAAFLAADEDSAITATHLERAARVEYEGMGKLAA